MTDTPPPPGTEETAPHKRSLSRGRRLLRLLGGLFSPGAYLHALKIVNYYNYAHVQPMRRLRRGPDCAISPTAVFSDAERIELGARVRIGAGCYLWAGPRHGTIRIGDDCLFGPEVMITAADYRFNDGTPVTKQPMQEGNVTLGRDVWLATRVMVMPGVTIGDHAIVGAGAIVTKDLPARAIAVGAPARIVGERADVAAGDRPKG
ncbi:acyltransferase [Roseospira marina]|uniref:Acyltransferase n=1 Tax=Roseospira marina TaxID=140057 RepID=A0A5M6IAC3_9PROT|nr:acyltransferase [Roseospira marina]KAA5604675.1 acyltransferase [Roseospira marina]MBB4315121.1 acetyltransferase-like isoleucine patch superfamily enzyme [Roseospira marina]MBB5088109.1 acetyltransferase-like isoleucine patch superfamily enzyme [Roseospira marina]